MSGLTPPKSISIFMTQDRVRSLCEKSGPSVSFDLNKNISTNSEEVKTLRGSREAVRKIAQQPEASTQIMEEIRKTMDAIGKRSGGEGSGEYREKPFYSTIKCHKSNLWGHSNRPTVC